MLIGDRLKVIRESKNMSQGDVEKKTGLLRCYLSRCENGHTIPSLETLEKWSNALDISMSQLFAENGKAADPIRAVKNDHVRLSRAATNHLRHVSAAFSRMEPKDMAIIAQLAKKFSERRARS
jgi:transcriptional regulator with XRE-family HTH domain